MSINGSRLTFFHRAQDMQGMPIMTCRCSKSSIPLGAPEPEQHIARNARNAEFVWTEECQQAFDRLKTLFVRIKGIQHRARFIRKKSRPVAESGSVANRWNDFEAAIEERFTDLEKDVRALQALERLSYKDDMFGFLTEWDELCERAGITGPQYRHKLLMAVGPEIQDRLQGQRIVETDEEFREQVLTTGRHLERWKQELGLRPQTRSRPDHERSRDYE
jgi:hypothetical protein